MRNLKIVLSITVLALLGATCMLFTACEDDPSMTDLDQFFADHPYISDPREDGAVVLTIEPASGNVSVKGDKVNFRVKGGEGPYSWDVSSDNRGNITSVGSSTAVYEATEVAENNVIVYDQLGHSAIANITATGAGALALTPSSVTISISGTNSADVAIGRSYLNGSNVVFKASGGVPPYSDWATSSPDLLGTISQDGVYTITGIGYGVNTVSVEDETGTRVTATVKIETTIAVEL